MKKIARALTMLLTLTLAVSVCATAFAWDGIFPSRSYLQDFYGDDWKTKYDAYCAFYQSYMSENGDPTQNPWLLDRYRSALKAAGYTKDKGFVFCWPHPVCPPQPGTEQPYPGYPYPVYPYYPYAVYQQPAQPVQRAVNLAPQEEYEYYFMTGETRVTGGTLVYKTKTRDAGEIKRSRIYVTAATLRLDDGQTFTWKFDEKNIGQLNFVFGQNCKATLTVTESNGTVEREVSCAVRSISASGADTLVRVESYDANGNFIAEYAATQSEK